MNTRLANKDDVLVIKELFWELDTDAIGYQAEHFIRTERKDDVILDIIHDSKADFILLEDEMQVIGFSLIMEKVTKNINCLKPNTYAYIQDFVIDESKRSKGYGSALMNASKEWAKKRNCEYIKLSVFPTNKKGIDFYKKNGLKENMITMECKL